MKRAIVRSILFNLSFYTMNAVACVVLMPFFFVPRSMVLRMVHMYVRSIMFLEYAILDLKFEVRGREHLPKDGAFIVAAKHQSPYETFKLHVVFDDPAIVLKQELLKIPLWGTYLKKSDVIAIDRSTPTKAIKSMQNGARRMKEQGRSIIVFPQGTRVRPDETIKDKPYKVGLVRIQEATDLPIVPMALNAGLFWPRSGFLKSSGTVVFEFLAPVMPGKSSSETLKEVETKLETASIALMNEAREKSLERGSAKWGFLILAGFAIILFGIYSALWFETAKRVQVAYSDFKSDLLVTEAADQAQLVISGYPGPIKASLAYETLSSDQGSLDVQTIEMTAWPLPMLPIYVKTGPVTARYFRWDQPVEFESLDASLSIFGNILTINDSLLRRGNFEGKIAGFIDFSQKPIPKFDLMASLKNHSELMVYLAQQRVIDDRSALFMSAALAAFMQDGVVKAPITQKGETLYIGPLPVVKIAAPMTTQRESVAVTEVPPAQDP